MNAKRRNVKELEINRWREGWTEDYRVTERERVNNERRGRGQNVRQSARKD